MASTGTVQSWHPKKQYGFVDATTGEKVFVHIKMLPEGTKLLIGSTVSFDMEPVEGHNGRMKGANVSGEGIVPIDTHDPAIGAQARGEERRIDPADNMAYTKEDFMTCYGGLDEWNSATVVMVPPVVAAGGKKGGGQVERRVDPADGQSYTKEQFVACYSGYAEWDAAAPQGGKAGGKAGGKGQFFASKYNAMPGKGGKFGGGKKGGFAGGKFGGGKDFNGGKGGKGSKGFDGGKGGKGMGFGGKAGGGKGFKSSKGGKGFKGSKGG
eukprot:gene16268-24930_t